ncbi:MAG: hypothetical protein V3W52_16880 [Syntrophobacteria bacterium]
MRLGKGRGQPAVSSRQKSEVRDQTSEVRVKLISDFRLLTSVIDDLNDFYGFYGFNDLPFTVYHLPFTPGS